MSKKLNLFNFIFLVVLTVYSQSARIIPWTYNSSINVGFDTHEYEAWAYEKTVNNTFSRLPFRMIKPLDYSA
ncbi:MAG: hypothetical protein SNJ77_13100, partial [Cytophagales bacterium]